MKNKQTKFKLFWKNFWTTYKIGFEKKDLVAAAKFLVGFTAVFLLLNLVVSFIALELFENAVAKSVLSVLNFFGIQGKITFAEPVLITLFNGTVIQISWLCTGLTELFVLVSAIAASFGITWRKKIVGLVAAVFIAPFFNIARIVATVFVILNSDLPVIEFTHNILFRIVLFITVVGTYFGWFLWATGFFEKR